jgi:hypothetical protein
VPARGAESPDSLTFGVSRHGEAVEAVGDDSYPGGDQEPCSEGLGAEGFEGPVESGGLVRLRTTRRDDEQVPTRRTRSLERASGVVEKVATGLPCRRDTRPPRR